MKIKGLILLIGLAFLVSCDSKVHKLRDANEVIAEMANDAGAIPVDGSTTENSVTQDDAAIDKNKNDLTEDNKKIIKDGSISIETKDITSTKKRIDDIVKRFNSYYDTEELRNSETATYFDLKIRIPATNFENLIKAIENGKDEVVNKSIHSRDVTEEFVDIDARLNSKRDFLKRYKDLLQKASTVKDILEVQESIRKLQEEIESKEGRLKYLNDQVKYSTLEIEVSQEMGYIYKPKQLGRFTERLKSSITLGWSALISFVLWGVSLWPFIIILSSIYLIWRRIYKHRKNRKSIVNSTKEK